MKLNKCNGKYNGQTWEDAEFPILCQTCLGDNPYIRMLKDSYGAECQVCSRPYTSFRWCPGKRMRYKKTEVCQICAKLKNICQTCLLDLKYGLPVHVRDSVLNITDDLPRSDANREYYRQVVERQVDGKESTALVGGMVGKVDRENPILARLMRSQPYYDRNRPHLCSFWQKGDCKRGDECPYRHEMPGEYERPCSQKAIRDRYYGVNDPVAEKILKRASDMPKVDHPRNQSITTLCILNVNMYITESDLYDHFCRFGELTRVSVVRKSECAFVTFAKRKSAETSIETNSNVTINGQTLKVLWAKIQPQNQRDIDEGKAYNDEPDPNFPHPDNIAHVIIRDIEGSAKKSAKYPSQDPSQMGSRKADPEV